MLKQYNKSLFPSFLNFKQNDLARFLSILEFVYNNVNSASNGHTFLKSHYRYHLQMSYKEEFDFHFKFMLIKNLFVKLRLLWTICC